jgi:CBS domain-containing protein
MRQPIQELMNPNPTMFPTTANLADAARAMRDFGVGDVLVERDGALCGIVTDRDIVVRAVAEGQAPSEVQLGDICSQPLTTLTPDDSVDDAVELMRANALRRLPVCENGQAVGIVSLGDLAVARDPRSALGSISAMPPNN